MVKLLLLVGLLALVSPACALAREMAHDIMPVWSGHPVGFSLLTHGSRQFVAFYDAEREMTVGVRTRDADDWEFVRLPEKLGWDSHNYVTMALDSTGRIHLSGNMHGHPLKYFRTRLPFNIHTFERVTAMVGSEESRVTYPVFFRGPSGELIFTYRDGGSGNGNQIYNVYDAGSQTWRRLLDAPLTDGQGLMNAYLHGPKMGPDGYFHLVWVWRDTGDCATNHDLSYARSKDLVNWEQSDGTPYKLPITLQTAEIIDPVPPGGGILNGNTILGWDSQDSTIVSYHKYDADGNTQLYNARREPGGWTLYQTSDWDYRWGFQGGGSIIWEIGFDPVHVENGRLLQAWRHIKEGNGTWILDEKTLRPTGLLPKPAIGTSEGRVDPSFAGSKRRQAADSGASGLPGLRYVLRWETLDTNRDSPREGPLPPPSMLRIIRIEQ